MDLDVVDGLQDVGAGDGGGDHAVLEVGEKVYNVCSGMGNTPRDAGSTVAEDLFALVVTDGSLFGLGCRL